MTTGQDAYEMALAHHRAGRLVQAEAIYRQILAENPRHADSLQMLGVIAHQGGRPDLSIDYINQALALCPDQPVFLTNLGEAHRALGQLPQARACFERALQLQADLAPAHYNLALVLSGQGDVAGARDAYRRTLALQPSHAAAHNNLGNALRQLNDLDAALGHYRQAIFLNPDFAEAHNNLGTLLLDRSEFQLALTELEESLRLQPNSAEAHYNLANALRATGDIECAIASYRRAIELAPAFAMAWNNLGTLLHERGESASGERELAEAVRLDPALIEAHFNLGVVLQKRGAVAGAEACYARAVALDPRHAAAQYNLGFALQQRNCWNKARRCYWAALAARPVYAEPHCNLGTLDFAEGRDDEALAHFEQTLAIDPDCAEAHYNRGMLWLGRGDFAAGWSGYAWRDRCATFPPTPFAQPAWDGSPLAGRSILVRSEQGLGDTLMFARYVPLLAGPGAGRVYFAPQPPLCALFESQANFQEYLFPEGDPPAADLQVGLLGLPQIFGTLPETIPLDIPYLQADPRLVDRWRGALARFTGLKVGICWQGNSRYAWDHLRSIPLVAFAPLAEVPGVELISLQRGPGREQITELAGRFRLTDLGDDVDTVAGPFMDTAAIIANLDLVITSDTALAHLAGALGAPVWVALSRFPEWRWQRAGQQSLWYGQMRLFRQTTDGDWPAVFAQIKTALQQPATKPSRMN